MTYAILRLAHIIGAILRGAGLIGVWVSDMRSRQLRDLSAFSEAVRNIAVFYDAIVAGATRWPPLLEERARLANARYYR